MSSLGLQRGIVRLEECNPEWADLFEQEKKLLQATFGERIVAIEHIGSTAISGIPAKPIIDINVAIPSLDDIDLIVTSPPILVTEYPNESNNQDEHWLNAMVGDLQRIREYPAKGFQIEQEIPDDVWQAYEFLIAQGYNKRLIKD